MFCKDINDKAYGTQNFRNQHRISFNYDEVSILDKTSYSWIITPNGTLATILIKVLMYFSSLLPGKHVAP